MLREFFQRLNGPIPERVNGLPTSSNRASSFHLFWNVPPVPLSEVSATITVIEPPTVDRLFFWALQANFDQRGTGKGGAHFGLQYHPDYPAGGAVNWGGYHPHGGGELEGSVSDLPSALNNVNTRTYRWDANRPYRCRIYRSPERGWRGSITDVTTGVETVVRDLWVEADALVSPMVWTEAFADCGDPSAAVQWSDLVATTASGERVEVSSVRLNYQTYADGGCTNTDTSSTSGGFVQRTATTRVRQTGTTLDLP